jgi:hypothetical protein
MLRFLSIALFLTCSSLAAVYERFPGFEDLYRRADFVGIIKLADRDVPKDAHKRASDWVGPHRFFKISSVLTLKGEKIEGDVARLADRRLGFPPLGEILTPEKTFLVFLTGDSGFQDHRYQWDEIHAEGSVLPVSPKTNLHAIDTSKPFDLFKQIVSDYAIYCAELSKFAKQQERLVEQQGQQGVAPQSATRSESDSEGGDQPQPEAKPRPR